MRTTLHALSLPNPYPFSTGKSDPLVQYRAARTDENRQFNCSGIDIDFDIAGLHFTSIFILTSILTLRVVNLCYVHLGTTRGGANIKLSRQNRGAWSPCKGRSHTTRIRIQGAARPDAGAQGSSEPVQCTEPQPVKFVTDSSAAASLLSSLGTRSTH